MRQPAHVDEIDGLRAVAVLAVLACHTAFGPVGYPLPPQWFACGARGVGLFFIVSGFCLAYPFLAARAAGGTARIDAFRFMTRRLVRIVPPYLAALATFALLARTPFGFPTYRTMHATALDVVRAFGFDAVFLTSLRPALNGSFWTLGFEMRWYLLFPFVLALYARSPRAVYALVGLCYVLALGASDDALAVGGRYAFAFLGILPSFILGIVAADLRVYGHALCRRALWPGFVLLAIAWWQQAHSWRFEFADPFWNVATFLLFVASGSGVVSRSLRWRPLRFVGVASYSIYLMHQPIVNSLESAGVAPLPSALGGLAAGFALYVLVERPCLRPGFRMPVEAFINRAWGGLARRPLGRTTASTAA